MPKKKATVEELEEKKEDSEKDKGLELALAQIEKEYGKGSVMTLGSFRDTDPLKHIATGSLAFDIILGKGGLVFGRSVELFGQEGSGKSTICLEIIAKAQKLGLKCAFADKEQALDPEYAEKLGVNVNELIIFQPNSGEETLSIIETLIKSGSVDVIILDSVAALNAKQDLEKTFEDNAKMAQRASMLTRFFERINGPLAKNKVLLILTNQMRANLSPYGKPTTTGGGWSLKHSVSQRIEIHPVEKLIDNKTGVIYGNTVRVKTVKNRMNSPYKEATFDIIFGEGIDKIKDLVSIAIEVGVIEEGTAKWYTYGDKMKVHGIDQAKEFFKENPGVLQEIREKTLALVGPNWGPEGKD